MGGSRIDQPTRPCADERPCHRRIPPSDLLMADAGYS